MSMIIDKRYSSENTNPGYYHHLPNYQTSINEKREPMSSNVNVKVNHMANTNT